MIRFLNASSGELRNTLCNASRTTSCVDWFFRFGVSDGLDWLWRYSFATNATCCLDVLLSAGLNLVCFLAIVKKINCMPCFCQIGVQWSRLLYNKMCCKIPQERRSNVDWFKGLCPGKDGILYLA